MPTTDLPPSGPDRLLALLDRGDLLRGRWTDGHDRMCALAALSDEVRDARVASVCPAALMPSWLAELVPHLDDCVSIEGWEPRMRRLGESARGWSALDRCAWERVRLAVLLCALDIAEESITVDEWGVRNALHGVREALQGRGDLATARAAAKAAAKAAAWASRTARAARIAAGVTEADWFALTTAKGGDWDRICDTLLGAIDKEIHHADA
jgi:hypothetical protein